MEAKVVVLVAATSEWRALEVLWPAPARRSSPFGEWFVLPDEAAGPGVVVLHGGWGKIAAAAATQYAIDRFAPELLVNLGTCGGLAGDVERGEVLLADETLVYDIVERMTDPDEAIAAFTTRIDLSWLGPSPWPTPVRRARLVSADGDIARPGSSSCGSASRPSPPTGRAAPSPGRRRAAVCPASSCVR